MSHIFIFLAIQIKDEMSISVKIFNFLLSWMHSADVTSRAWLIHRQHSPSGPIVGQSEPSEPSADDDNQWPVRADVSRWCYSLTSPSHGLYRAPMQNYSRFRAAYVFDDCSSTEGGTCIYLWWGQANNPCSTVQALRGVSVFKQAGLLLPCWTNNHCPKPGLNVVIKHY